MTDKPASLAEALALLQTQLPEIRKTSKAQYGSYANLTDVSRELLPVMGKLGLSFTCAPTLIPSRSNTFPAADELPPTPAGVLILEYALRHAGSHEVIRGYYPLPASGSPQQIGSAITYGRRYCLCAVTGAVAEEDDDGAAASQPAAKARTKPPARPKDELPRNTDGTISRSQTTDEEKAAAGIMTDGAQKAHNALERDVLGTNSKGKVAQPQGERLDETPPDDLWLDQPPPPQLRTPQPARGVVGAIHEQFTRLGFTPDQRDARLKVMSTITGRPVGSTNDLDAGQAVVVRRFISACKDRGALAAKLLERQQETPDAP